MPSLSLLGLTALLLIVARITWNWLRLRSVPGPFLAGLSDLWRVYYQYSGSLCGKIIQAHKKYGPVVRYGTRTVSLADPAAVTAIYESRPGFNTADSYKVLVGISNGKEVSSLVSTPDQGQHKAMRKSVAAAFTPQGALDMERYIDQTLPEFRDVLAREGTFDFAKWANFYSMESSSLMIFEESMGFLERGQDVSGVIGIIRTRFIHWARWSPLPSLERLVYRNPIAIRAKRTPFPIALLAARKLKERMAESDEVEHNDLLQKFLEAGKKHPDVMHTTGILGMLISSMSGTADTTATSLTATLYYLLKNCAAKDRLLAEFREAKLSVYPSYAEVSKLPYLNAVIREAIRLCPVLALPIERRVPAGGVTLAGVYFPEGTTVGCSQAVIHQDASIFGEEPKSYRPERWLEVGETERRRMDSAFMGFGKGARVCLGQNIALMQMKKAIPMLLQSFEFSFVHPDHELDGDTRAAVLSLKPVWMKIDAAG